MRINIMRDVIKYSSLASCDSHIFPSEFQPGRRVPGELRRLSNITEHSVQREQSLSNGSFSIIGRPPDWPTSRCKFSAPRGGRRNCLQFSKEFGKKRKMLKGNQRVEWTAAQPPNPLT